MGCSTSKSEPQIITRTQVVAKPAPIVPSVNAVNLKPVQWKVITSNNYKQVFDAKPDQVFFSLDTKNYENLSLNMNDLRTLIQQQKAIILLYKKYYK